MTDFQNKELGKIPKLLPHDYVVKYLILPFFPRFILPNHVTVFRFLAAPFVFWLLWSGNYQWGIPFFIFAALTDAIDGSMARVRNQITPWGILYDPLADKILIIPILILLIFRHLNVYLAFAMVALEVLHLAGFLIFKNRNKTIQPNFWGKTKMVMQAVSISALLFFLVTWSAPLFYIAQTALAAAILFAVLGLISHGISL